jgi:hypothetical protein
LALAFSIAPVRVTAQDSTASGAAPIATRAELEAALPAAEAAATANGLSTEQRAEKRNEADMIRQRLREGDFQYGDQIIIEVQNDSTVSRVVIVGADRTISLPGMKDISMRGVLRSEAQDYLSGEIARYVKDPVVKVRSLIRISLLGGVNKPGFYQLDADMFLSDAIMAAGGINGGTDLKKSTIKRGTDEIVKKEEFAVAVRAGRTLDQLNLRAGDEIELGVKKQGSAYQTLQTVILIPTAILSLYGIGKIFGAF